MSCTILTTMANAKSPTNNRGKNAGPGPPSDVGHAPVASHNGTQRPIPASGGSSTAHRRNWDNPLGSASEPRSFDLCRDGTAESGLGMRYLSVGTGVRRP